MSYASDLNDSEWELISPIAEEGIMGCPRTVPLREILNGIFYISKTGCQWRMLPKDFPHWKAVYSQFDRWRKNGRWDRIHEELRKQSRQKAGRKESPSAGIIDSQSVKTVQKGGSVVMMQERKQKVVNGT